MEDRSDLHQKLAPIRGQDDRILPLACEKLRGTVDEAWSIWFPGRSCSKPWPDMVDLPVLHTTAVLAAPRITLMNLTVRGMGSISSMTPTCLTTWTRRTTGCMCKTLSVCFVPVGGCLLTT